MRSICLRVRSIVHKPIETVFRGDHFDLGWMILRLVDMMDLEGYSPCGGMKSDQPQVRDRETIT